MSHSSRGPTNSDTSRPCSAPIAVISASSRPDSSIAPLPWDTRLTVMPSAAACSTTARSTAGPSTLGISIRKSAPSGNRAVLRAGAGPAMMPCRASTCAPVSAPVFPSRSLSAERHESTSSTAGRGGIGSSSSSVGQPGPGPSAAVVTRCRPVSLTR